MIINRALDTPLYLQLYNYFKNAILSNELPAYTKLPSIRQLASKHAISKTTIEKAYNQLSIEGFIQSQPKSGYYVLPIKKSTNNLTKTALSFSTEVTFPNIAQPVNTFDMDGLKKALNHVVYNQYDALYHPPKSSGENELKDAIMQHLRNERGVKGSHLQMIIGSGIQNHLITLSMILPKRTVGYIVPLFYNAETMFKLLNYTLVPCQNLDEMLKKSLDLIYISPSNLYPSGDVIPFNERMRLIDYAKKHNAYILEDDYNYIYRHNAFQIPSIQGLSNAQNVIYIGSFTRQVLPSFRISYMVLPASLMTRYNKTDKLTQTVSIIDQLTMAEYIKSGLYQKHLKKLSAFSKKQNEAMRESLAFLSNSSTIQYAGLDSNLHVLFHFKDPRILNYFSELLSKIPWYYRRLKEWPNTVLLPYHGFTKNDFSTLTTLLKKLKNESYSQ